MIALRKFTKFRREERGDSLVEFAISATVLLMVIFGIMDCSRALYAYHFVSYAAQEGTRYAIVRGANFKGTSCSTTTTQDCDATAEDVQDYVRSIAPPSLTGSSITVTTTWPGTDISGSTSSCQTVNDQGCLVKVSISYPFSFLLPFLPGSAMTFSASSEQAIQE